MPFISRQRYEELVRAQNDVKSLRDINQNLLSKISDAEREKRWLEWERNNVASAHTTEKDEMERKFAVDKETSIREAVEKETKRLTDDNRRLTIDNKEQHARVSILTKAFENLGFDVKDMKEILNKLVDGIVSKNTIQLVK